MSQLIPVIAFGSGLSSAASQGVSKRQQAWARANQFNGDRLQVLAHADPDSGELCEVWIGIGDAAAVAACGADYFRALAEKLPAGHYELMGDGFSVERATHALAAFEIGRYRFDRYKSHPSKALSLRIPNGDPLAAKRLAEAINLARDLINTPAEDGHPEWLAEAAKALLAIRPGTVQEWVGEALLSAGFNLIHAVGRASSKPPRLLELRWEQDPSAPWVAVVGKGVCFDTGGLDMKTSASMALMKKDMGGAAVSIGLAQWLLQSNVRLNLQLIIPAVINAVDGDALRPSDVIRSRAGKSVEITNTDAEGRLVLADALSLVHPEADLVLDLATLTGAARVALGPDVPAVFCNQDALWEHLQRVAAVVGEPLWRLPLVEGYREDLKSKVADLSNSAAHGFAGAIVGALFIEHFVPNHKPWVHIDLYGWNPKERAGFPQGAEAHALKTLAYWLLDRYGASSSSRPTSGSFTETKSERHE